MCHGLGFIIVLTSIVYAGLIYYNIIIPYFGKFISKRITSPISSMFNWVFSYMAAQILAGLAIIAGLVTFVAIDSRGTYQFTTFDFMIYRILGSQY